MKRNFFAGYLVFILLIGALTAFGQVTLSGPTCVVPGVSYQYKISGTWDSTSTMQVCISGGVLSDSTGSTTCTPANGAPLANILIVWSGTGPGSLTLSSAVGNNTLNVNIINQLQAGVIDSTVKNQMVPQDTVPATITCSANSGGDCSPSYTNQWQQSSDVVSWTDIPAATTNNLTFTAPLGQTTYFRRKVIEIVSGTIAYSDVAAIFMGVSPSMPDSSSNAPTDTTGTGMIRSFSSGHRSIRLLIDRWQNNSTANVITIVCQHHFLFCRTKRDHSSLILSSYAQV